VLNTSVSSSVVSALAVKRPDGHVEVMIVNVEPNNSSDKGGTGFAQTVSLTVNGMSSLSSVSEWVLDRDTDPATGPSVQSLSIQNKTTVTFPGYGVVFLEFAP
jgi:hypothetical protein